MHLRLSKDTRSIWKDVLHQEQLVRYDERLEKGGGENWDASSGSTYSESQHYKTMQERIGLTYG